MAAYDNSYSRMVAWLKIILPLIALALLSTMFLLSRSIDPTRAIPFARVDVEDLAREPRLTNPRFSSVTEDGAAISFAAATARPDPEEKTRFSLDDLVATIDTPDGAWVTIDAGLADIDSRAKTARLSRGVVLVTSTEYTIRAPGVTTALDLTRLETDGTITAEGPLGRLEAGHMDLARRENGKPVYLLVFKNGVKLVYDPKAAKGHE